MKKTSVHYVTRVVSDGGRTFIESRARAVGGGASALPPGKVLVARTPILPPGATEEELTRATETRIVDDEENANFPCERCARRITHGVEWLDRGD